MSSDHPNLLPTRPQRILACVGCQQRKIKCDRKFPCLHCTKSKTTCTPATKIPRRRRRRFAEQELLDRLHTYEELLQQNNIDFEPLGQEVTTTKPSPDYSDHVETNGGITPASSSTTIHSPGVKPDLKSFWHAVNQRFRTDDEDGDSPDTEEYLDDIVNSAMDSIFVDDSSFLFGRQDTVDLSPLHPDPAHIFRLWQLFLDNVNPLLKVIHTPTMQVRIIEAIGNIYALQPPMEALMFAIYSMAILSLEDSDCRSTFAGSKPELLKRYQFGCQQALQNSGFLKSEDRDCLTAFFLYLFSYVHSSEPKALSSAVAMAIRIAQRMQLDSEYACAQHDFLEGEMRRRLWWALLLFDVRVSQLAGGKTKSFLPIFSTRTPLNSNDSTLAASVQDPPISTIITPEVAQEQPTESIYVVVKANMGNFICHTAFHLAYNAPELLPLVPTPAVHSSPGTNDQITHLEKMLESRYLSLCNPSDPLHFMTIWETRSLLAKCRLMEYYRSDLESSWTETQFDTACQHAIRLLECNNTIKSSPLTKPFRWMTRFYFPFPAYIHLLKHLKRAPLDSHARDAWDVMSTNFTMWLSEVFQNQDAIYMLMGKLVLGAWAAKEEVLVRRNEVLDPDEVPGIVTTIRKIAKEKRAREEQIGSDVGVDWLSGGSADVYGGGFAGMAGGGAAFDDTITNEFVNGLQNPWPVFGLDSITNPTIDPGMNQLDWTASAMDWGVGQKTTW
ncbi:unnamed protein product [Periconia digitata]|uniref:Zn(2)-C6 fungal-type domain-containing protein n=1 Tax=Periconia digitata TaxID=1303443 RepID=A0A9W4XIU5_9PLEO|nr:unnamed protein product [Periconia digitata]